MKILMFSSHNYEKPFLQMAALGKHELVFKNQTLDIDSAISTKGFVSVSLFTSDNVTADVLNKIYTNGVKFITLRSAGYDNVDLFTAKKLGIKVANVPNYSPHSIAEHTVTLLMALNRKILLGQTKIAHNNFCLDGLVGFDLYGKTVGIVGTGKIGANFARIMNNGFGCKLLGYDIVQNKELISQTHITYTTLDELCNNADIVSLHCPLTKITHHLFNKYVFAKMKKGVILINTARGAIVNTIDLIAAIENGTIAAAGLDVYENEKPLFFINHLDKPILDSTFQQLQLLPNVLITGHQAFLTKEALTSIAQTTIKNISEFSTKGYSENDLN
jgi:D-lactate dehydrogenase